MLSLPAITRRWISSRSAAAAAILSIFLASGVRADIHTAKQRGKIPRDIVNRAPASAVPRSEEIDPGEQVEITLEAHGGGGKAIEFDFASQPRHGALTGFHITDRNKAVVTYVHNPDSGPGQDSFTYRVQATGMEMSGPATVDISIRDYPPKLAISPAELDFGAVNVGETTRAQVTVRNDGGGLATGRVEPPAPWVVEGADNFRLGGGEKQVFHLAFKPTSGRSFSETVRVGDYGVNNVRSVDLHLIGTGLGEPEKQYAGINGAPPKPLETPEPAPTATPAATPTPVLAGAPGGSGSAGTASFVPGQPGSLNTGGGSNFGDGKGGRTGPGFEAPQVYLNEAGVKAVQVQGHGRTTMEIAWKEPQPKPSKYRVELRYLSLDPQDNLIVTWQPYAKLEYRVKNNLMTASLSDLPPGTNQSIRVVAVDGAGNFAAPSPMVQVQLEPALRWWRLSFLQWLLIALAICVGLVVRQRLQERQILQQIDEERSARRKAEA